jgi:NADH dehydrogenase FAD-containing subunit
MSAGKPTQVLILGGGFGGLYAAMHLDKTLARGPRDIEKDPREHWKKRTYGCSEDLQAEGMSREPTM